MVTKAMVESSVDGEVDIDYAGLTWRFTCPANAALEPWSLSQLPDAKEKRISEKIRRHLECLVQVKGRSIATEHRVNGQHKIVARLQRGSRDSSRAKQLLNRFEEFQPLQLAYRDRLEKELISLTHARR
jgi:hypothetical protein